jgi:hypothetical protein
MHGALAMFGKPPFTRALDPRLVDAEVVGDNLHVHQREDEQREGDHADGCEHNQDGTRESVGR